MTPGRAAFFAVTIAYWAFMLTDGALRMLVLLHFHGLGFSPLQLAFLFLLYEVAGLATNLSAGFLAARFGLTSTLLAGLALQIAALLALAQLDPVWSAATTLIFVICIQGASGVAKDLTKTASKSAVKLLAPKAGGALFTWVAALTGSKNAIKGAGFFLGAALLALLGFAPALITMASALTLILMALALRMPSGLPTGQKHVKASQIFATDARINWLSGARLFLFGARDVWFVVAVPVFLTTQFTTQSAGLSLVSIEPETAFFAVGAFMAVWIIGYGAVQGFAPRWLGADRPLNSRTPQARYWARTLVVIQSALALAALTLPPAILTPILILGLMIFGVVFALNSALHSYLILAFSRAERVTMDVGFYYMANAAGRLVGTLLSGLSYQLGGLALCLAFSAGMAGLSALTLRGLKRKS